MRSMSGRIRRCNRGWRRESWSGTAGRRFIPTPRPTNRVGENITAADSWCWSNFCLFALVSMQDDGLLILPTHRLIGGLEGFNMTVFKGDAGSNLEITQTNLRPEQFEEAAGAPHAFGLYEGTTRKLYLLKLTNI